MSNIVLLFVCLLTGMALRWFGRAPENGHASINAYIVHVALPALILSHLHGTELSSDLVWPILMPWFLFLLSAAIFLTLGRVFALPTATTGALILTAGLANTSFVGLPMIETFYGPQDLPIGIIIDQLGTYLVLSTLGILTACIMSNESASARNIAERIITFPPLIALVTALLLTGVEYPPWATALLQRLGDTLAPLALVSVGLQLRLDQLAGNGRLLGLGLAFKLVLGPLALAALYLGLLPRTGDVTRVTIFESAMGPQIGGAIVAVQYGLNPNLITLMVGVGILLSFITLPVWWWGLSLM